MTVTIQVEFSKEVVPTENNNLLMEEDVKPETNEDANPGQTCDFLDKLEAYARRADVIGRNEMIGFLFIRLTVSAGLFFVGTVFGFFLYQPSDKSYIIVALVLGLVLPWAGAMAKSINTTHWGRRECELLEEATKLKRTKPKLAQDEKAVKEKCMCFYHDVLHQPDLFTFVCDQAGPLDMCYFITLALGLVFFLIVLMGRYIDMKEQAESHSLTLDEAIGDLITNGMCQYNDNDGHNRTQAFREAIGNASSETIEALLREIVQVSTRPTKQPFSKLIITTLLFTILGAIHIIVEAKYMLWVFNTEICLCAAAIRELKEEQEETTPMNSDKDGDGSGQENLSSSDQ